MEIIVGVTPEPQSLDALALGRALATTMKATLVVANVFPVAYNYASPANVDAEWHKFLVDQAKETLDAFRDRVPPDADVDFCIYGHKSSGVGLAQLAEERGSSMIVIGSAPGGSSGRIMGGSTSDQLLHGSPVPVAIAPHDYRASAPRQLGRTVVAYQRTPETDHCLDLAVGALVRRDIKDSVRIHLLTIVERVTRLYGHRLGHNAEDQVLEALRDQAREAQANAIARIGEQGIDITGSIVQGDNLVTALSKFDWADDDILLTGSTDRGPILRVFLGDMTYKILRAATVPVMVVPRSSSLVE